MEPVDCTGNNGSIVSQTGLSDAVRVKLPLGMFHGSVKGHDI